MPENPDTKLFAAPSCKESGECEELEALRQGRGQKWGIREDKAYG